MKIIIPGEPVPLARPRYNTQTHQFYNAQSHIVKKQRAIIKKQLPYKYTLLRSMALTIDVTFHMPIPASYSPKIRKELINTYHRKRPDVSNLLKWVEDVCNGLIYYDDCLISTVSAHKVYTNTPQTIIYIRKAPKLHYLYEQEDIDEI